MELTRKEIPMTRPETPKNQSGCNSTPTPLSERTPEEQAYWEAFAGGGDMGDLKAPPMVITPDLTLWQSFDHSLHPDLKNAVKLITEWYNERLKDGYGLALAGNCGCGKTHLAKAIKAIHIMRVKYWSEIDLIKAIQASFDNKTATSKAQVIGEINRAELFILDDLGAYESKNMEWLHTVYMDLFDARCDEKRPFVITTNLTRGRMFSRVGERVASRIIGALDEKRFYVDLFKVPDYRLRNFDGKSD